jgi:hypothetical protein
MRRDRNQCRRTCRPEAKTLLAPKCSPDLRWLVVSRLCPFSVMASLAGMLPLTTHNGLAVHVLCSCYDATEVYRAKHSETGFGDRAGV